MKLEFLTPVGRLVQGDPFEAQTTNMQGQPLMTKQGAPTQRYFIAVAFKKGDPAFNEFYGKLDQVARSDFPHLGQNLLPPWDARNRFSWKVIDGDGFDDNGKPNNQKPGMAGHWVVKFSSSFAPRCFHTGRYQPHEQIQPPQGNQPSPIPRGYYVRVAGTIEGNGDSNKPGLYVNLSMVELCGGQPSDVIVSGPDASSVFGRNAPQLPPGVAAPMLPPTAGAPAMPQAGYAAPPMPQAGYPAAPAPAAAPPMPQAGYAAPPMPGNAPAYPAAPAPAAPGYPQAPTAAMPPASGVAPAATTYPSNPGVPAAAPMPTAVAPNPAFLAGPGGVPGAVPPGHGTPAPAMAPGVGAPPAAPSSAPQMTAAAGGATYEQFRAQGWTDEQLRANGYML